ncbi:MAG: thrombospondin type 3 repeat-containing protein, partial [Patescibacteria group bacterium]
LEKDTDPQVADSDGDGYLDGEELLNYGTDPNTGSRPAGLVLANVYSSQTVEEGHQFLMGRSEENTEVLVYAVDSAGDSVLLGETITDEEGKFAVYTNDLAAGVYELVVVQTDGKRDIENISYPLTFVVSPEDLLEEPVMKRLGEKLVMNNTTILATWESVLLGVENDTDLVDSGVQLMVGQSSDPNSSVEIRAVLEDGTDQFLGQATSDKNGKYTLLAEVPVEGDYAIYAYTRNAGGEIVDTSFPLLLNVKKDDEYLVSRGGVIQLDYAEALRLESIAVDETTAIVATWTSLVLSSTLVTDSVSQPFEVETPRPLDAGRHAVTVYVVDRESGKQSKPVRIEFDVLRSGVAAPALSDDRSPWWIIGGAAFLIALLAFIASRRKKKQIGKAP